MRLIALLLATSLFAADAPKAKAPAAPKPPEPPVYLTETEAAVVNTDYKLQGEYANAKMGANVIALGKDEFRLILFKGGLPGAGWDGTPKIEVEGKRDGEGVLFKDNIDSATLADGGLTIKSMGITLKRTIPTARPKASPPPRVRRSSSMDRTPTLGRKAQSTRAVFLKPTRRPNRPSPTSSYTSSSSYPSSPSAAARVVPTAASTYSIATKSRSSTASASRA